MIDVAMYAALGFLIASLLALMLAPPLWKRAVRLTTRRVEATMPMSVSDIQADKDQLRAEFAIELRRVEVARDKARDKAARELVEANKRRVEIAELKTAFDSVKGRLQEKENANRVLEQTIRRRLPELETSLKAAKQAMAEFEAANAELRNAASSQAEALKLARTTVNSQRGDIDQLRGALGVEAASSRRSAKSDSELAKENRRLNAEFSKLKEELTQGKIGGKENDLLRRELGTLAKQILAVAKAQGMALPELAAAETSRSFVEEGARETPNERAPAFIASARRLDGDTRPRPRELNGGNRIGRLARRDRKRRPRRCRRTDRGPRLACQNPRSPQGKTARQQRQRRWAKLERAAEKRQRRGLRRLIGAAILPPAAGGETHPGA